MFDIYLTYEIVPESDNDAMYGRIQIEDYTETFVSSLVSWTVAQYERHWLEACQRLLDDRGQSALISTYVTPSASEFLVWWPLYREREVVHVRNEIVPYEQLNKSFSVADPWSSIRERKTVTDDGFEISEWDTRIQSIEEFIRRRRSTTKSRVRRIVP